MTDTSTEPASPAGRAASEAANVASTATEQATTVAKTAAEEAKAVGTQAAQEAKQLITSTKEQLRSQASDQAERVASALGDLGGQLQAMADAGQPGVARDALAQIASQAQGFATRLNERGLDASLDDARRFARNRPGLFLLGAAAAGLVTARIVRAADTQSIVDAAKPQASGSNGHTDEPGSSTPALGGAGAAAGERSLDDPVGPGIIGQAPTAPLSTGTPGTTAVAPIGGAR